MKTIKSNFIQERREGRNQPPPKWAVWKRQARGLLMEGSNWVLQFLQVLRIISLLGFAEHRNAANLNVGFGFWWRESKGLGEWAKPKARAIITSQPTKRLPPSPVLNHPKMVLKNGSGQGQCRVGPSGWSGVWDWVPLVTIYHTDTVTVTQSRTRG